MHLKVAPLLDTLIDFVNDIHTESTQDEDGGKPLFCSFRSTIYLIQAMLVHGEVAQETIVHNDQDGGHNEKEVAMEVLLLFSFLVVIGDHGTDTDFEQADDRDKGEERDVKEIRTPGSSNAE